MDYSELLNGRLPCSQLEVELCDRLIEAKADIAKMVDLMDEADGTCWSNGWEDVVSLGRSQYMALIDFANEKRG